MPGQGQARRWCFTLNNYTDGDVERIRTLLSSTAVRYGCFGREVGENGTRHLQGYVAFTTAWRFARVKQRLGNTCHVEQTRGTEQENSEYCEKDGDFETFGTKEEPGRRKDLEACAELIRCGQDERRVAEQYPGTFIRYYRGLREYKSVLTDPGPRTFKTQVST